MYNPPDGKDYKWYISGIYIILGGGFRCSLLLSLPGEMIQFDGTAYFIRWVETQPPTSSRSWDNVLQGEIVSLITCWNCSEKSGAFKKKSCLGGEKQKLQFFSPTLGYFFFCGTLPKNNIFGKNGWLVGSDDPFLLDPHKAYSRG